MMGSAQWLSGLQRLHRTSLQLNYRLYLPAGRSEKEHMPLLVMLHGCKQDAETFAAGTRMNELAERKGFAVLYPEQSRAANPYSCWNWFLSAALESTGEAGAIAQLVEEVTDRYRFDRTRTYIAGMSAGAAMARIVTVRYGALFAGCALHSGLMYRAAVSPMQATAAMRQGSLHSPRETAYEALRASRPGAAYVPTLVIHGDRDDVVHPLNAEQIVEQCQVLAERLSPSLTPLIESREHRLLSGNRAFAIRDYARQEHVLVRKILVEGLGHAWSGGNAQQPFNDSEGPSATELIWEFLQQHGRLPNTLQPVSPRRGWPALVQRWMRW